MGLPIQEQAALPFLLTARLQGELASVSNARAYFAEGLASSYEAFHHTRDRRSQPRDTDNHGQPDTPETKQIGEDSMPIVPVKWYEQRISELIPSRSAPREERMAHPKIEATVKESGEAVGAGRESPGLLLLPGDGPCPLRASRERKSTPKS